MKKYVPKMYKESIFEVDYEKLEQNGIKCIIFDLDNTLVAVNATVPEKKVCYLIKKLKKIFKIFIVSNNSSKKRLDKVADALKIDYISFALKPLSFGFKKILKKGFNSSEVCIIGDQIMTDVLGGNRMNIFTVLVEPIDKNELKVTSFNRYLESKKVANMEKLGLFKKGEFYG